MSRGQLRIKMATIGIRITAAIQVAQEAARQFQLVANVANTGKKINWPVALLAVSIPNTNPRRFTNQRFVMVALNTVAVAPVAEPIARPQKRSSCQGSVIKVVRAVAEAVILKAISITRRNPKRSIKAAAKGPNNPNITR